MSSQTQYPKVALLGVQVDALTIDQAIAYIMNRANDPQQPACYVVKPYVEFLDQAAENTGLQKLLNGAELSLPDGIALIWAAAYLYGGPRTKRRFWLTLAQIVLSPSRLHRPLPQRAAGINFTWPLLEAAARQGTSVFLIGSPHGTCIEQTAEAIHARLPQLRIVGTRSGRDKGQNPGSVSEAWREETLTILQDKKPGLVLIGIGFPLQEQVAAWLSQHLGHGVLIGEGGTFDYEQFGGNRPKAPAAVQAVGLEWLWRLILEPKRFQRQLAIPRFIRRIWHARHKRQN